MCTTLAELRSAAEAFASQFDAATLSITGAGRLLRDATALKNIFASVERELALRVAEGPDWRRNGSRSPAEDIAKRTGTSVGEAIKKLQTAEQLKELPEVADAARRGELSPEQTDAVASAASAAPAEEERLVAAAKTLPLKELQSECGRTRAAHTDAEANRERIRRARSLRSWTGPDGTGHLHANGPAEQIAAIMARISAERDRIFNEHRREGNHESPDAYAFDALVDICRGESTGSTIDYKLIIRVDFTAQQRGYATEGEVCDIAGVPVPVSVIEDLLATESPFLTAVITQGEKITGVVHLGRAPTAKQQTALEFLYPTCAAEGCSNSARLQRDHREDWAKTHVTIFDFLDLLCAHHHGLKTTKGWKLVEGRGKRAFVPPDDPRHPQHAPPDAA